MYDLVGIGSINIDLIFTVDGDDGGPVDLTEPVFGLEPDDIGNEIEVGADRIRDALARLHGFETVVSPGGSSLNTVAGIAATEAPLSLGFVGVLGVDDPSGTDVVPWLRRLGVDDELITAVDGPPGLCLAMNRDGQRTLLTAGGANDQLTRVLAERHEEIVRRLRTSRHVHVTSLAGLDDLDPLLDLLDGLSGDRAGDGEGPTVSCDPGVIWTSSTRADAGAHVIARSRQLFVNRREFDALGNNQVFDRFPNVELVVIKAADRIEVVRRADPVPRSNVYPNRRVLAPGEIVDDTGAGDAFAAGYLIGSLLDGFDETDRVELGMELARRKLGFPGVTGIEAFAGVHLGPG